MRAFCFTVDLDRDSNIQVPGQTSAGSMDRGYGIEPRFDSSLRGLKILSELFSECGVEATFFAEGRTLESIGSAEYLDGHEVGVHGYDHEDFTLLRIDEKMTVLQRSMDVVKDVMGECPKCFRAPYMRTDEETMKALSKMGIRYDSSRYTELGRKMFPTTDGKICEVPISEGKDRDGNKIVSYLWPMHEEKRGPEDYIEMASFVEEGIFNIATHTWHIVESRADGEMSDERMKRNIDNVRKLIVSLTDLGYESLTIPDAVKAVSAGMPRRALP